jgi:hypothetical protein
MVLGQGSAAAMKQSRGTECIQAPEMLMAGEIKCFCLVLRFLIDSFSQVPSMPLQSTTVENPYQHRILPMCGLLDAFFTSCCLATSCSLTLTGRSFLYV